MKIDTGLRMEVLLMRSVKNVGIGYLASLIKGTAEVSDFWYWHGVCRALNYTDRQFKAHCKRLLRALLKEAKESKK